MDKDDFNLNAKKDLLPPLQGYDVHIYFEDGKESEKTAQQVAERIQELFPEAVEYVCRGGISGPHTAPNFAVKIMPESFGAVVGWLQLNSRGLSILVHPLTGNVLTDHLDSALWLGKPVELSAPFFARARLKLQEDAKGPVS